MTFPEGVSEITGEFVALDRPERVSFTWRTDAGDAESIVTVLLAPHGDDHTHMTIIHSRQPPALVPRLPRRLDLGRRAPPGSPRRIKPEHSISLRESPRAGVRFVKAEARQARDTARSH